MRHSYEQAKINTKGTLAKANRCVSNVSKKRDTVSIVSTSFQPLCSLQFEYRRRKVFFWRLYDISVANKNIFKLKEKSTITTSLALLFLCHIHQPWTNFMHCSSVCMTGSKVFLYDAFIAFRGLSQGTKTYSKLVDFLISYI